MRRSVAYVGMALVAVGLIGCGGGGSSRKGARPPEITVTTPSGTVAANVTIDYRAIHGDGNLLSIEVEYSTDGGASFAAATDAGPGGGSEGTTGLPSSPAPGTAHVFVWSSGSDLPGAVLADVRVRITPSNVNGPGIPGTTGPFGMDNSGGATPSAVVQTPTAGSGNITVDYDLVDAESDPLNVLVEYSIDSGASYQAATEGPGSQGTTSLSSSPGGDPHFWVWDSVADIGANLRLFCRIRITPSDAGGPGTPGETGDFAVDNTVLPNRLYTLDIPLDPAGPDTLSGYDLDLGTGGLTAMAGSPWSTGGDGRQASSASDLIASSDGKFFFASHNESHDIEVWSVDNSGVPTRVPGSPFPVTITGTGGHPTALGIHQSDRFLYAALGTDLMDGFEVDPTTGALTLLPGFPYSAGSSIRDMAVHPKGNFLYTGHMFGADGVRVHAIDPATGGVTYSSELDLSSYGGRPGTPLTIDPMGARLFCGSRDAGMFVADIDPVSGALTLAPSSPVSMGTFMGGATTTRRGNFVYAHLAFVPELLGFRVESNGDLTPVPGSPYTNTGGVTAYLKTDGTDRYLFAVSRNDNNLRIYEIQADGSLVELPSSPFSNANPAGIMGPVLLQP